MKRIVCIMLCLVGLATVMCGCLDISEKPPADSLNYSIYVNREITLVLNCVETHMGNATLLTESNTQSEVDRVQESLNSISEAILSVQLLKAPDGYNTEQKTTIERMQACYNALTAYYNHLCDSNITNYEDDIVELEMQYSSLKAMFHN